MLVPIEYELSSSKKRVPQMSLKIRNGDFLENYMGGTTGK
jgi:hypothetical protein